jgi:hypothetical protein
MRKKDDLCVYVAKYVTKQGGDLHFGGTLQDVNFSEFLKSRSHCGRKLVVQSADLNWEHFHLNDPRRKK